MFLLKYRLRKTECIKMEGTGKYAVCLEVNGRVYHKKISVNF